MIEGRVLASHVTHEDFPFNHDSHDMCFFVAPDPEYQHMQSDANGTQYGERALEVEWETKLQSGLTAREIFGLEVARSADTRAADPVAPQPRPVPNL